MRHGAPLLNTHSLVAYRERVRQKSREDLTI